MKSFDPSTQDLVDEFSKQNQRLVWFFQDAAARVSQDQLFREFEQIYESQPRGRSRAGRKVISSLERLPRGLVVATGAGTGGALGYALTSLMASGLHAALVTGVGAALASVLAMRLFVREHNAADVGDGLDDESMVIDVRPEPDSDSREWDVIPPLRLGDVYAEHSRGFSQRSVGDE